MSWKRLTAFFTLLAAVLLGAPQTAEAKFVFPHNHPDLEWYSIETEHFVVHYPMSKRDKDDPHYLETEFSARKTAQVAEDMWAPMCEQFNYFLKERVHIVLLNQSDYLEGFTIPSWDWIQVSTNPGSYFYRMRGRMEWISDVMVHEFAHVVSLKANSPLAEGAQGMELGGLYRDGIRDTATGASMYIMDNDPFYWTEGGAEYWSDEANWNWWTAARDMNIRMTVLDERLLTYDQWQTRAQAFDWGGGERGYQQGYSFALYLRQRFGPKTYTQMAIEGGKRWRMDWNTIVEDVTGVDAETLYHDWVAFLQDVYGKQVDAIRAEGEVVGREVLPEKGDWDFSDPSGRDEWNAKPERDRTRARERTGTWMIEPRVDAESGLVGINNRGAVVVQPMDESIFEPFTGKYATNSEKLEAIGRQTAMLRGEFMHGWDLVPGKQQVVTTGTEHMMDSTFTKWTGIRHEGDGYNWKQLWVHDIVEREDKVKGRKFNTWSADRMLNGKAKTVKGASRAIPNTLRGQDPAVSPDGSKIAYLQYSDGTLNLATINFDGTEKTLLTDFDEGTWMQHPDWSPDGKHIVFSIFRHFRQDLYIIDADGSNLRPITWDAWESQDAHWADDGKIYFSSDPTGVYNIFSYDLENDKIEQLTNVISGAECPVITPEGNLLYTLYTSYGWKLWGLHRGEFFGKDATDMFVLPKDADPDDVKDSIAYREDLSHYEGQTEKYNWTKALMPPTAGPSISFENDSMTNLALTGGFYVFAQDFAEKHGLYLRALMGEDNVWMAQYFLQNWYTNMYLTAYRVEVKYDYGFMIDEDDDLTTTNDQSIYEGKNQQAYNIVSGAIDYPWSNRYSTMLYGSAMEVAFRTTSEPEWEPYMLEYELGGSIGFTNISGYYARAPNPPAGRNVELTVSHAWTDVVYEPYGGVVVDDGMLFDEYEYNKFDLRWVEFFNIPTLGGFGPLAAARSKGHRIQLDTQFGFIDRNVDSWGEFRAGGQHPAFGGYSTSVRPQTQFAGYPFYSLSGETLGTMNLAYRFPIKSRMATRVGPFYFTSSYLQFMGTAGNLWSFRPPEDPDLYYKTGSADRVAYDPADVKREIPLVDSAYKNGNYLLYDAGAELRVSGVLFNAAYWNSFLRVAYGFNEIGGYGDVDGDDIQSTASNAIGDELSVETEKPGLRFYIGLGTGW